METATLIGQPLDAAPAGGDAGGRGAVGGGYREAPRDLRAGWHLSGKLAVPDSITLRPLPPRSPELNRVENVWQFLRDEWLSNRVFRGYDDIVAHCREAWNELMEQPWRIHSIGRRAWADAS